MSTVPPSRFVRAVLRADAFAVSSAGTTVLIAVMVALVTTGTAAGGIAATVLFAVWIAVGRTGRRHRRRGGPGPTAEDR
ncbi:hypothetical protein [Streptomyces genisteinicus]|uniref:Uncharacterized protein n=1 Tax=Streptomyces genisteinicus TaxID=2768068 RepID=A0A7H0HR35_9ACTN|nr:hypothetical protein [Streptomyces genisteinicus]QNP63001.1 hypothetical protein IAG43_08635 [Streptomyces genisteinicus]